MLAFQLELESSLKTLPSRSSLSSASGAGNSSQQATDAFIERVMGPGGLLSLRVGDAKLLETAVRDLKKVIYLPTILKSSSL